MFLLLETREFISGLFYDAFSIFIISDGL
jgi:hypothetical protein